MVCPKERRLKNIYSKKFFCDFVNFDKGVWLNIKEFARPHLIDGQEIICVLAKDSRERKFFTIDGQNLSGENFILFVDKDLISSIQTGESVNIDGKIYLINNALDIQNVMWRIELTGDLA